MFNLKKMAFSFECPHCEMGFEAEFELCGSTCTCPGCGGLFLVPEVDQAALESALDAGNAPSEEVGLEGARSEVFLELARLREELAAAEQRRQELEHQLAEEKARTSQEGALSAELKEALGAKKKAETLAKDLGEQLKGLQDQLSAAEGKLSRLEETTLAQRRELERAGDQLRNELAAAMQAAERAKQAAEQPSQELAKLRGDLEKAEAKAVRLDMEFARERERTVEQLSDLRTQLEKAVLERKVAEEQSTGRSGELERIQAELAAERRLGSANLEKLEQAQQAADATRRELEKEAKRTRVMAEEAARQQELVGAELRKAVAEGAAKVEALEKERDGARTALKRELETLQKQLSERKLELERSGLAAVEASRESERLRAELSGVKAEKWSAERGFAEEHERLLERLRSAEIERDTIREDSRLLTRAAAQPDGEVERLRGELSAALASSAEAERTFREDRAQLAGRLEILEQARDAAGERSRGLLEELSGLRSQLELAQARLEAQKAENSPAPGLSAGAEAGLRQTLAKRDLEIQRLASELRGVSQSAAGGLPEHSFLGWLNGRVALALSGGALALGLLGGAALSRPKPVTVDRAVASQKTGQAQGATSPSVAQGAAPSALSVSGTLAGNGAQGTAPAGTTGTAQAIAPAQAPAAAGSLAASRVGMPSSLPDQFLGIRFGTDLGEVAGITQWKETAGKRHRKAELLGSEVEAVLTTDAQNRLIMGSYVRVASRQAEALTPFLEWAVNVQDAVSALYGEPIRVHSVEGATDAGEVVRKIAAGEDFYQATWEREVEDGMIDLSIRVFNERSVVFRMEYRARQLYGGFIDGQAPKDGVKDDGSAPAPSSTKAE
jgi:hypothetical protein